MVAYAWEDSSDVLRYVSGLGLEAMRLPLEKIKVLRRSGDLLPIRGRFVSIPRIRLPKIDSYRSGERT
jgi:hypothetical protein